MITLPEPPLPERDDLDFAWMSLSNGILLVELNPMALANFRWSLWLLVTGLPRGEDIDIWSSRLMLPPEASGAPIGYCEITLTGEGPVGGRLHNPNAEMLHREDRVDLFVNRMQAEKAYQDLESLSGNKIGQSVTLFGKLTIKVVETKGEPTNA